MAVAERVAGTKDIRAEVVFKNDEFEYTLSHGRKSITKHTQKLENINEANIVAAYCVIKFGNGKEDYTEIMTIEQIHKAWDKSRMNTNLPSSTHSLFPGEMCKRTVINRACKKIINASSDSDLFLEHFNRLEDEQTEDIVASEIEENANRELIDVKTEETTDSINVKIEEPDEEPGPTVETPKRDPESLKTIGAMYKACFDDFGMQPATVMAELNVKSNNEIVKTPSECYTQIRAVHEVVK